jgi:hypothetical protein
MSYAYQWKRGGVNISGATANTYTLVTADIGAMITATVTATNTAGSASATAAGVGPVIAAASNALQAQAGSFAFAGHSATLTPPVGGGALSIQAQPGSFAVTGESMQVVISYLMQVDAGAFALAGQSANLAYLAPGTIQASAGAFALAGQSATLTTGSGAAFTPASLANLYAWYKADVGVLTTGSVPATTDGQAAVQWNDQSGVSNINLVNTNPGSAIFKTNFLNAKPVVQAEGTSLNATMALGGSAVSVWAVVRCRTTSSGRAAGYGGASVNDTAADAFIAWFYSNTTTASGYQSGVKSTATIVDQSWNSIMSVWGDPANPGNHTLYVNGAGQTPVASSPTFASSGRFTVMNAANDGNGLNGEIAELVVVKGAFTAAERTSLAAYSVTRWGV